jgi:hypothetical protein
MPIQHLKSYRSKDEREKPFSKQKLHLWPTSRFACRRVQVLKERELGEKGGGGVKFLALCHGGVIAPIAHTKSKDSPPLVPPIHAFLINTQWSSFPDCPREVSPRGIQQQPYPSHTPRVQYNDLYCQQNTFYP